MKFFLSLLLCSSIHFCLACGNQYYSQLQLPLKNDTLQLYFLLKGGDLEAPYWVNGFFDNVKQSHTRLKDSIFYFVGKKSNKKDWLNNETLLKNHYRLLSDYAWHEIRVGDKNYAIRLLEKLYTLYPNEYNILANLGTAYELISNNSKALELLRKAVEINPGSHEKSEWIHIKILEQKLTTPPNYASIIDLKIKDFPSWLRSDTYQFSQNPEALKKQIAYQLHERISFIKAPDPIIAQLLLDFADIVAKQDGNSVAIPFYEYANTYADSSMKAIIFARKQALNTATTEIKTTFRWAGMVWALPLIAFVFIFIAWIRSTRKQSKQG